jgi:hypothetical protein
VTVGAVVKADYNKMIDAAVECAVCRCHVSLLAHANASAAISIRFVFAGVRALLVSGAPSD